MDNCFELVIIGAGPGGYEAAFEAADKGMRVAIIEKDELGGTCLNRGCIPTKTILNTADLYREVAKGPEIGLEVSDARVDMEAVQRRKEEVISELRDGIAKRMKTAKITVFKGTGTILDREHIRVSISPAERSEKDSKCDDRSEMILKSSNILIATGSVPSHPPITGSDLPGVLTSDELLDKKEFFDSLVIIGGGVIGMEFASIYASCGKKVTVIEAMDRILPGLDKEFSQSLKMILKKRGADIHTGAKVEEIMRSPDGDGLICRYTEKERRSEAYADGILIAAGRRAFTEGLISEETSGEVRDIINERGIIPVDRDQGTPVKGIYAVGDVTGGIQLAHAAAAEAKNAVSAMTGKALSIRTDLIPSCVYTDPEIASVGLTADEAKERGIACRTKKYLMGSNGRSVLTGQERGYIKAVVEEDTGRILGAQMMCARATDMISQFTAAIAEGLTCEDMSAIVYPHPTFSEAISEAVRL